MMQRLSGWLTWLMILTSMSSWAAAAEVTSPVIVGISAEYGMKGSQVAQSIEKGILLAMDEINAAGGVLGGRRLALETRDDRGLPARAIDNFRELANIPDVVAVFCGRFSPVALEVAPVANKLGLLYLDPWAAADGITRQPAPGYVFRLSLTDSWAIETMLQSALRRGYRKISLFVPNNAWGRSSEAAAQTFRGKHPQLQFDTSWYNWGDTEFSEKLLAARHGGAQMVVMVANEAEGTLIVQQMAALKPADRLPIISHWGVIGGDFAAATGTILADIDFSVVTSFTFNRLKRDRLRALNTELQRLFGHDASEIRAQVGFAHAYDMTHLLAKAIRLAGSTDRAAIRDAMQKIGPHTGIVRRYEKPFADGRHEALDAKAAFMARFRPDGSLDPIPAR